MPALISLSLALSLVIKTTAQSWSCSGDRCWLSCGSCYDCSFSSSSPYSCYDKTFTCPTDKTCSISCAGYQSCRFANFGCGRDCVSMNIVCSGYASCSYADISWPAQPGSKLTCADEYQSCLYVDFPDPAPDVPLNVECGGARGQCAYSTIRCPSDAPCGVSCGEEYSCYNAKVTCPTNHRCNITCGREGGQDTWIGNSQDDKPPCQGLQVEWPDEPGLGSLTCISVDEVCRGVNLPQTESPTATPTSYYTIHPTFVPTFVPTSSPVFELSNTGFISVLSAHLVLFVLLLILSV